MYILQTATSTQSTFGEMHCCKALLWGGRPRPGSPGAAVATIPPCCSSPHPLAPASAFGVLLHWMVLPDAPAPVPGALALPPFLDGNLRCAPGAYPCSGAFATCAVCGGL